MSINHGNYKLDHQDILPLERRIGRRQFLTKTSLGLGAIALGKLLGPGQLSASPRALPHYMNAEQGGVPNFPSKAKRVCSIAQSNSSSVIPFHA